MRDPANPSLILSERPDPVAPLAALRRRWACGRLSFLPATEVVLLMIFAVSVTLFFSVDDGDTAPPSKVSPQQILALD